MALRVLTAVNKRQHPDPKDVALLRAYCPEGRDLDVDDMACMAIEQALRVKREHREHERSQTA